MRRGFLIVGRRLFLSYFLGGFAQVLRNGWIDVYLELSMQRGNVPSTAQWDVIFWGRGMEVCLTGTRNALLGLLRERVEWCLRIST
jgi:hypothetical protein